MRRSMMSLTIVLISAVLWGVGNVQAFSWSMGSVETTEYPFEFMHDSPPDLPTPRFFRLVINNQTGTLVVEEPYVQPLNRAPKPRFEKEPEIFSSTQSHSGHHVPHSLPRQLSGVEALLLRDAETLVLQDER